MLSGGRGFFLGRIGRLVIGARIATLFPDSGSRYLSTIFNDSWMREKGLLD